MAFMSALELHEGFSALSHLCLSVFTWINLFNSKLHYHYYVTCINWDALV